MNREDDRRIKQPNRTKTIEQGKTYYQTDPNQEEEEIETIKRIWKNKEESSYR